MEKIEIRIADSDEDKDIHNMPQISFKNIEDAMEFITRAISAGKTLYIRRKE